MSFQFDFKGSQFTPSNQKQGLRFDSLKKGDNFMSFRLNYYESILFSALIQGGNYVIPI